MLSACGRYTREEPALPNSVPGLALEVSFHQECAVLAAVPGFWCEDGKRAFAFPPAAHEGAGTPNEGRYPKAPLGNSPLLHTRGKRRLFSAFGFLPANDLRCCRNLFPGADPAALLLFEIHLLLALRCIFLNGSLATCVRHTHIA